MSEMKFTPGPWSVPHFARPDVNCECKYVLSDGYMGAVAAVYCSGDGNDWMKSGDNPKFEEAVANACLIASAPDLYAALIETLEIATRNEEGEFADRARAALAKAKGISP